MSMRTNMAAAGGRNGGKASRWARWAAATVALAFSSGVTRAEVLWQDSKAVYAISKADHQVFVVGLGTNSEPETTFTLFGRGPAVQVRAEPLKDGSEWVAVLGADRRPYFKVVNHSVRTSYARDYQPVGHGRAVALASVRTQDGRPLLFAVGEDHATYVFPFDAAGLPVGADWIRVGAGGAKSLSATLAADGTPILCAVSTDGQGYSIRLAASGEPKPSESYRLIGGGPVAAMSAGCDRDGRPMVSCVGAADGRAYAAYFDGAHCPCGGWVPIGHPGTVTAVKLVSGPGLDPILAAVSTSGEAYSLRLDKNGRQLAGEAWKRVGPGQVAALSPGRAGAAPLLHVVGGTDFGVFQARFAADREATGTYTRVGAGEAVGLVNNSIRIDARVEIHLEAHPDVSPSRGEGRDYPRSGPKDRGATNDRGNKGPSGTRGNDRPGAGGNGRGGSGGGGRGGSGSKNGGGRGKE